MIQSNANTQKNRIQKIRNHIETGLFEPINLAPLIYFRVLFGHYLGSLLREAGYDHIEIRTEASISLNGREPQLLIDPTVDLTKVQPSLQPSSWILPLKDN